MPRYLLIASLIFTMLFQNVSALSFEKIATDSQKNMTGDSHIMQTSNLIGPIFDNSYLNVTMPQSNKLLLEWESAYAESGLKSYEILVNDIKYDEISFVEYEEAVFNLPNAKVNYANQGNVYLAKLKNIDSNTKLPVMIAIHGSGRKSLDYRDTPFYRAQRDIALKNGYLFAAVSNGPDTWGLDDGLYNVNLLYDYLQENYPVQNKAALWVTSAGGTLGNRMVYEHGDKVDFVIGTFPVYDLLSGFNLDSCKTAWGTTDIEVFKTLIKGKNPSEFSQYLKNHNYYIAHGTNDTSVPLNENSQRLKGELGDNVTLQIIQGGVHGTSNYDFYTDAVNAAFRNQRAKYEYALENIDVDNVSNIKVVASDINGNSTTAVTDIKDYLKGLTVNFIESGISANVSLSFINSGISLMVIALYNEKALVDVEVKKVDFTKSAVTANFNLTVKDNTDYLIKAMLLDYSNHITPLSNYLSTTITK